MEKALIERGFQAKGKRTLLKVLTVVREEEISGRSGKDSSLQAESSIRADAHLRLGHVLLCGAAPMVYEQDTVTGIGMCWAFK